MAREPLPKNRDDDTAWGVSVIPAAAASVCIVLASDARIVLVDV